MSATLPTLQIGNIVVWRIVEHDIPVYRPLDMFDEASPEALEPYRTWLEPDALCPISECLVMPVLSYLVKTQRHTILIDTCVGCDKTYSEPPTWHQALNRNWLSKLEQTGTHPGDIDYVFCTHLHSDHCGWNTRQVDGRWVPTFPNARYIFSKAEYDEIEAEGSEIFYDNVHPIVEAGQVKLVEFDYALDDEIWLEPSVGHTAGHVSVNIKSNGQLAVMCGDLIHSPLQLREPGWSCNSDTDIMQAARTRIDFLERHVDNDTLVLTSHFPLPSIGRIVSRKSAYDFRYI